MYLQRFADRRDLPGFVALGRRLGFAGVELGHVVEAAALERLAPGEADVPAVHHPCPALPGGPAAVNLLAPSAMARRHAADAVLRTLETALRYGSRVVVLHLGRAEDAAGEAARRLTFELTSRHAAGQAATSRCVAVADELRCTLDAVEAEWMGPAVDTLGPVAEAAAGAGVRLALETGYAPYELPRPPGMSRLLDELGGSGLGAWLDTGHVGAQVSLGLASYQDWSISVAARWLGAHLHDVVGVRDHLVPGMGGVDFSAVLGILPADAILTCEVDWYFTPEEVRAGRARIEALL